MESSVNIVCWTMVGGTARQIVGEATIGSAIIDRDRVMVPFSSVLLKSTRDELFETGVV